MSKKHKSIITLLFAILAATCSSVGYAESLTRLTGSYESTISKGQLDISYSGYAAWDGSFNYNLKNILPEAIEITMVETGKYFTISEKNFPMLVSPDQAYTVKLRPEVCNDTQDGEIFYDFIKITYKVGDKILEDQHKIEGFCEPKALIEARIMHKNLGHEEAMLYKKELEVAMATEKAIPQEHQNELKWLQEKLAAHQDL
ncbi:exported hypothetical protein [Gammaproteobacteria bacterium]